MKTKHLLQPSLLSLMLAAGTALAQVPRPAVPPREPFLKDRGAPTTLVDPSGTITAMTTTYETYTLPTEDLGSLLGATGDATARYRRITDLLKLGRAKLEVVQGCTSRSGFRTLIESNDGVMMPDQLLRGVGGAFAFSQTGFFAGDRVEMQADLSGDGRTCNLNVSLEAGQFVEFRPFQPEPNGVQIPGLLSEKRNITTSLALRTGEHVLLGTLTRPPFGPGGPDRAAVVFVRVAVNRDRPETPAPEVGAIGYTESVLWFYSLEKAAAQEILASENKPGAYFQAVKALQEKRLAKLEHTLFLPSQGGMRGKVDENMVGKQPGQSVFEGAAGRAVAGLEMPGVGISTKMPGANLGISVEVQTDFGPPEALIKGLPLTGQVYTLLNWRSERGRFKTNGAEVAGITGIVQEGRKVDNALPCYPGVPTFVSTINPPRETGVNDRKDDGRAWLAFIQATPVRP